MLPQGPPLSPSLTLLQSRFGCAIPNSLKRSGSSMARLASALEFVKLGIEAGTQHSLLHRPFQASTCCWLLARFGSHNRSNLKTIFLEVDSNRSGAVEFAELHHAFQLSGVNLDPAMIAEVGGSYDTDKDGTLEFDDSFCKCLKKSNNPWNLSVLFWERTAGRRRLSMASCFHPCLVCERLIIRFGQGSLYLTFEQFCSMMIFLKEMKAAFSSLDSKGCGSLDLPELCTAFWRAGINFPEGLILQIGATCLTEQSCMCLGHGTMPSGKTFDRDNSGGIEFDEFIQMTAEWHEMWKLQECFSPNITADELQRLMGSVRVIYEVIDECVQTLRPFSINTCRWLIAKFGTCQVGERFAQRLSFLERMKVPLPACCFGPPPETCFDARWRRSQQRPSKEDPCGRNYVIIAQVLLASSGLFGATQAHCLSTAQSARSWASESISSWWLGLHEVTYVMAAWAHLACALSDPGAVPLGALEVLAPEGTSNESATVRWCGHCQVAKPPRAHHCSTCQRCIRKMDHHCMWMNNCIGGNNQKHFILFLSYTSLHCLGVVPVSLWCLFALHPPPGEEIPLYAAVSFGSVLSLLLAGCLGRYCLQLLKDQFHSLKKNQTFIEQLQGTMGETRALRATVQENLGIVPAVELGNLCSTLGPRRLTLSALVSGGSSGAFWIIAIGSEVFTLPLLLGQGDATFQEAKLLLPDGFGDARCARGLGTSSSPLVALGSSQGHVAWWSVADWRLLGRIPPVDAAGVLHLTRVWTRPGVDDPLTPEAFMVAVLDELGKCRLLDLSKGEVLCKIHGQSGLSFWDQPFLFISDSWGAWVSVATRDKVWTWDTTTGAFAHSRKPSGHEERMRKASINEVCWQAADGSAVWQMGEVILDGRWKLPVLLCTPQLLRRDAPREGHATEPMIRSLKLEDTEPKVWKTEQLMSSVVAKSGFASFKLTEGKLPSIKDKLARRGSQSATSLTSLPSPGQSPTGLADSQSMTGSDFRNRRNFKDLARGMDADGNRLKRAEQYYQLLMRAKYKKDDADRKAAEALELQRAEGAAKVAFRKLLGMMGETDKRSEGSTDSEAESDMDDDCGPLTAYDGQMKIDIDFVVVVPHREEKEEDVFHYPTHPEGLPEQSVVQPSGFDETPPASSSSGASTPLDFSDEMESLKVELKKAGKLEEPKGIAQKENAPTTDARGNAIHGEKTMPNVWDNPYPEWSLETGGSMYFIPNAERYAWCPSLPPPPPPSELGRRRLRLKPRLPLTLSNHRYKDEHPNIFPPEPFSPSEDHYASWEKKVLTYDLYKSCVESLAKMPPQEFAKDEYKHRLKFGSVSAASGALRCFRDLTWLRGLGVHLASERPMAVGVLGVDEGLSFPQGDSSAIPSMSSALQLMMEDLSS
eukprot:g1546.t1